MGVKGNKECVIPYIGRRNSQKNKVNSMNKVKLIPDGQSVSNIVEVTDSYDENDGEEKVGITRNNILRRVIICT